MIRGESRQKKFSRCWNTVWVWWIVTKKRFRLIFFGCVVIAYATAYFSLASNSTYIPTGQVTYIDRHKESDTSAESQVLSLYESRLPEIQEAAAKIAREYLPVSQNKQNSQKSFYNSNAG